MTVTAFTTFSYGHCYMHSGFSNSPTSMNPGTFVAHFKGYSTFTQTASDADGQAPTGFKSAGCLADINFLHFKILKHPHSWSCWLLNIRSTPSPKKSQVKLNRKSSVSPAGKVSKDNGRQDIETVPQLIRSPNLCTSSRLTCEASNSDTWKHNQQLQGYKTTHMCAVSHRIKEMHYIYIVKLYIYIYILFYYIVE